MKHTLTKKLQDKIWNQFLDALEDNCEDAFVVQNNGFGDYPHYELAIAEPYASFTVEDQLDYLGYFDLDHFVRENA